MIYVLIFDKIINYTYTNQLQGKNYQLLNHCLIEKSKILLKTLIFENEPMLTF